MRSIRSRLTLTLSLVMAAIVVGFAVIGAILVPAVLYSRDAAQLHTAATRAIASLDATGGVVIRGGALADLAGDALGAVLLADGEVLTSEGLPAADVAMIAAASGNKPTDVDGRYLAVSVDVSHVSLVFAADGVETRVSEVVLVVRTAEREATRGLVVAAMATVATVTTAALVAAAAIVVGRGMRPLAAMAERAGRLADGDRTARLPVDAAGDPAIARMAQTVNLAFDVQEDAENRIRAFVADASHELRTPLTAAAGWIELYLRGGLEDKVARDAAMDRVEGQLRRLRLLTDELSLLARTDAGRPLEQEPVDLADVAADVVRDARVVHPARAIAFEADAEAGARGRSAGDLPATAGPVVLGDEARLAQVLRNLVGNALQHTPADAAVTVEVVTGGRRHLVRVVDSGPGIPSEDLPHLFERFWRGDPGRAPGGSGLGLPIVQALVEAHGGAVTVSSGSGGTVFEVSLPAAPA